MAVAPTLRGMSRRGNARHVTAARRRLKPPVEPRALLFHTSERAIPPPTPCPTPSQRLPGRCLPWILTSSRPRNRLLGLCASNLLRRMSPRCSPNMLHRHQDTPDRIPPPLVYLTNPKRPQFLPLLKRQPPLHPSISLRNPSLSPRRVLSPPSKNSPPPLSARPLNQSPRR